MSDRPVLDRLDRKILNAIQRDSGQSNKDLAKRVGTSPPSCLRRVRRLRQLGLIAADIALINREKVGGVVAVTTLNLSSHDLKSRDQLLKLIRSIPEITQCYMITGGEDMLLISYLRRLEDFEEVIAKTISECKVVAKLNTTIAYRTLKFEPFIVFEDDSWDELQIG
jgi:Lrp/AsnC family leucine-responsive transcriptional regulator